MKLKSFSFIMLKFLTKILLILSFLTTVSHGIDVSRKLRLAEEDMELDKQLNILNKPAVKRFKNKNCDLIDCIDIYKQPAFDHPLLKDHKLQMRPSSVPKGMKLRGENDSRLSKRPVQRENEGCPYGTVPFKRIKKEDLIRAKTTLALNRSRPVQQSVPQATDVHQFAVVTTPTNDPSKQIYGAAISISVYNLTDQSSQISEALLWIGTGVHGSYSGIEYGWTVNKGLYGDGQSRTYSLWTGDGLQNTGCYNAFCPGYVQVSQKRIMGEVNHPVTIPGEDVYAMEFKIFQDPKTSNWWLFENLGDTADEPVGYWPKELFPTMGDSAKVVQSGGKVSSPLNVQSPARMGSGAFLPDDFTRTCYASNIEFVDSKFQFYEPKDEHMIVIADVPDTYKAEYLGNAGKEHPKRGYTLLFGGPGIR